MQAITVVAHNCSATRSSKIQEMYRTAGFRLAAPDKQEQVRLTPEEFERFEGDFADFAFPHDPSKPFQVIRLEVMSFEYGLKKLSEMTHAVIPDEFIGTRHPIPAELFDCVIWPQKEEDQQKMDRYFRPMSMVA